jgi:UDP-GlcNAc:undecaprenyl-phosphate GlcNAc-1-phosphate transferase
LLDGILITLSYYAAYLLLFGPIEESADWDLFLKSLPILIVLKLSAFLFVGVYRGLWRYTSIGDFITYTKAVALGSILSILAILLIYRFQYFSRTVFILDGIILLFAVISSRMTFRLIRQFLQLPTNSTGRKVLIYGAGDGGEMVLRELKNNSELNYQPVGFVDDDPLKKDKMIHGLRVFGGNGALADICRERQVQEILISFQGISPEKLSHVKTICREADVSLKRAQLKIESVDFE